jgi:regulator of protease activity HflC (stomatin/prohibitin superfamily)
MLGNVVAAILVLIVLAVVVSLVLRRTIIYEYQRGLKYVKGRFKGILTPGQYYYMPLLTKIDSVDVRLRLQPIGGQEVLTSDAVALKVSLVASYEIVDPVKAVISTQDYEAVLHSSLQLALRSIIGAAPIDQVLEKRGEFGPKLMETCAPQAKALGLHLVSADVRDIMFPGVLKQTFAQVARARQEGMAALERARGETAALRNLANAARMIEKNPVLLQLRFLQTVSESSGNTFVLGVPPGTLPLNAQENADTPSSSASSASDDD